MARRLTPEVQSRFDADDVVQDALCEALRRWPDGRHPGTGGSIPFTWLYRIAMQKYVDRCRAAMAGCRDAQLEVPLPDASVFAIGAGFTESGPGVLSRLQTQEMGHTIRQGLALLSERDRDLIRMRVVDELTFVEIGEVLQLSDNAATVAFARALRKLREACQRISPDFESVP